MNHVRPGCRLPLTDPELDLLRELLEEDPSADAFLEVGRELVRREEWQDAARILAGGLPENPDEIEGWQLLARAAVEAMDFRAALQALERLQPTPEGDPELVKLEIRALAGIGEAARARALADSLVLLHPALGSAESLVPAATRAGADPARRGIGDPLVSSERAELYVLRGRVDRAVRVFRRMLFHEPRNMEIRARLGELLELPHDATVDDLSEELPDPSVNPPELRMPLPSVRGLDNGDDEVTAPSIDIDEVRRQLAEANSGEPPPRHGRPLPGASELADLLADEEDVTDAGVHDPDEVTDPTALNPVRPDGQITEIRRGDPKRKRRSLIRK